jgi:uncharacterized protein (DUF362 family)
MSGIMMTTKKTIADLRLSRRDFLRATGTVAGGMLISEVLPARPARAWTGRPQVALARAYTYNPTLIRRRVQDMLDQLGGLSDVVRPGDRVVIKPNLTGGSGWQQWIDVPADQSMVTHAAVVRALAEAVIDAGAGKVSIAESIWDWGSYEEWGYVQLARDLNATLIDLNSDQPYGTYVAQMVGENSYVYDWFTFNPALVEADVFMSAAKLKCHQLAGVTLSMKNLVGTVPVGFYQLNNDGYRTALHGPGEAYRERLPRVIVDLNRARPVNFALIDGIRTSEGGEGPWNEGWNPKRANVLIAGKNPVATDAVATAVMGFNPAAWGKHEEPFMFSLNHLVLARLRDLGPHRLEEIDVVGEALDDVVTPFKPYRLPENADASSYHPGPYGTRWV